MSAVVFKRLAALGLTTDQIVGVMEIFEETAEQGKEKARARWRKWKDSKRLPTTANVSKQLARAEDSSSIKDILEEEKKGTSPSAQSKRGSRIPTDFQPDINAAVSEGVSLEDAQRQARSFVDYWTAKAGKDGLKLDWPATWRVWYRRNIPTQSRQQQPRAPRNAGEAALAELMEQGTDDVSDQFKRYLFQSFESGDDQRSQSAEVITLPFQRHGTTG